MGSAIAINTIKNLHNSTSWNCLKTPDKYKITNIQQLKNPEIAKLFDWDKDVQQLTMKN